MAGPSKVEFPGQKKRQRMRARGTKKASAGVRKKLENSLAELLDDPGAILPIADYVVRRARKDPVQRSLRECAKVIEKKNNRKWLGKRMVKRRGDGVARALAGSLHVAHDDELKDMVAVFDHAVFGTASFIRRGGGKPTQLISFQNFSHPTQRLLTWEEHAKAGWWFFSVDSGIICTGIEPEPPEGWLANGLSDSPIKFTPKDGVYFSKNVSDGDSDVQINFGGEIVHLSEDDLNGVDGDDSFVRSIALRVLPPKISEFTTVDWSWRPEGWPNEQDLPSTTQEKINEVMDAWMNLSIPDARLIKVLRRTLCNSLDVGCIAGESWYALEKQADLISGMSGSAPEKEALDLVLTEIINLGGGIHVNGNGDFEELEDQVIRLEERSCHANLVALWPEWGEMILEDMYGITGDDADEIIQTQTRKKQGFGALLKKLDAQRAEHKLLSRFPWKAGEMDGLCGYTDGLIRKAHTNGVGSTITAAKKGKSSSEKALGWAWICVHERSESEGWHFDSDARDKGGDWIPALKVLFQASEGLADGGGSDEYIDAMQEFANRSGATDFVDNRN
ncbi:MAG: hypothetical protein QGF94_02970 [Candidatus Thalassarchaeaceae archaeon]|jgi:hypothetical protein|nr:hypothetical protein [Candidatus Thalassarchaeaceae archaeon]